jgi:hypothetical protein
MAPASNVHNPQHWLERAAMRVLAGEIKSEEAKAIMLRLAVVRQPRRSSRRTTITPLLRRDDSSLFGRLELL